MSLASFDVVSSPSCGLADSLDLGRLYGAMLAGPFLVAGIFWLGWTGSASDRYRQIAAPRD